MTWFFIALIAPALWSLGNHIDKHLLEKYVKDRTIGALMIFSSLGGLLVIPAVLIIDTAGISLPWQTALLLMAASSLGVFAVVAYLKALQQGETSTVVPLFQLVPIFYYIMGKVFLHETLSTHQTIGALLILLGAIALSAESIEGRFRFKAQIFLLMGLSSLLFATNGIIFKAIALDTSYAAAIFWEYVGGFVMALSFLAVPIYRKDFWAMLRHTKTKILGVNAINEILALLGDLSIRYASLLAPIAAVQLVNGFHPVFVLIYGVLFTFFLPRLAQESLLRHHVIQKVVSILVIVAGSILLTQ